MTLTRVHLARVAAIGAHDPKGSVVPVRDPGTVRRPRRLDVGDGVVGQPGHWPTRRGDSVDVRVGGSAVLAARGSFPERDRSVDRPGGIVIAEPNGRLR